MSDTVTGTVFKVYEKTWPKGNTTYSVKLEDNPIYFRTKAKRFAGIAEPGQLVTIVYDVVDATSANVVGDIVTAAKPQAVKGATYVAGAVGDRSNSIVYQSSRKDALAYIELITKLGAIKLPEKQAAKLKALDALLDSVVAGFFEDVNTLGAVTRANGGDETPAPAEESKAKDEEE